MKAFCPVLGVCRYGTGSAGMCLADPIPLTPRSHLAGMHRACATAAPITARPASCITASLVIVLNKDASVSCSLRAEEWNQRVLGNSSLSDKLGLILELVQFGWGAL